MVEGGCCVGKYGSYRKDCCPAYGKICNRCGKQNHFATKCKSAGQGSRPDANVHEFEIGTLRVCTTSTSNKEKALVTMTIGENKIPVQFKTDSGAECNVMTAKNYVEATGDPNCENLSDYMYNASKEEMLLEMERTTA